MNLKNNDFITNVLYLSGKLERPLEVRISNYFKNIVELSQ